MHPPPQDRYKFKPFAGSSHLWAIKHLESVPTTARVLDIGTGSGIMGQILKDRGVIEVFGIEPDAEARAHVRGIYKEIHPSIDPYSKEQFDLVLMLDVLEHMVDPFSYIQNVVAISHPGTIFLISVPNVAHWSVRLQLLFGFFEYTGRAILDKTHLQFFNRRRFKKLIAVDGRCRIEEISSSVEPVEFVFPKWIHESSFFSFFKSIHIKLAQIFPGLLGYQHLAKVKLL